MSGKILVPAAASRKKPLKRKKRPIKDLAPDSDDDADDNDALEVLRLEVEDPTYQESSSSFESSSESEPEPEPELEPKSTSESACEGGGGTKRQRVKHKRKRPTPDLSFGVAVSRPKRRRTLVKRYVDTNPAYTQFVRQKLYRPHEKDVEAFHAQLRKDLKEGRCAVAPGTQFAQFAASLASPDGRSPTTLDEVVATKRKEIDAIHGTGAEVIFEKPHDDDVAWDELEDDDLEDGLDDSQPVDVMTQQEEDALFIADDDESVSEDDDGGSDDEEEESEWEDSDDEE
jgi:hypothetical protein